MGKRVVKNRLNNLDSKSWLKFQKSWFIHNPPPRRKDVLMHPAKFPETLAQEFIEFFTKQGETILDPMAGTGSALIAALRVKRHSFGIELNPKYANIANKLVDDEREKLGDEYSQIITKIIQGDAQNITEIIKTNNIPLIDYVITSPPYWDMLHQKGASTQKQRRFNSKLDVIYSDNPTDIGNIHDYEQFLEQLTAIYVNIKAFLKPKAYLTIIVKNVKKGGKLYPLAWDLAKKLESAYTLKDEKIWCQDNQRLFPYGYGNAWVSNTFHHYCLQFRNDV
ncbi:MAG: hypothetical protein J7L73_07020 [Anaerolineales bacterium]|nr:hypothetical protein [Anaerolineales bacterium]